MNDNKTTAAVPACPNGLFNFPYDSILVEDADEEIMELYMNLATISSNSTSTYDNISASTASHNDTGLGFYDPKQPIISIDLELRPTPTSPVPPVGNGIHGRSRRKSDKKPTGKLHAVDNVQVELVQDLSALKSRKGDTGSVLWRSSLHLAQHLLQQHHYPPKAPNLPLLSSSVLSRSKILELGAGTGLLSILLSPLCFAYTVSDRLENLRLIKTNLIHNDVTIVTRDRAIEGQGKVRIEEVDWLSTSKVKKVRRNSDSEGEINEAYDLILAVDCIYNEHLIQPLVDTLSYYCQHGKTVVWVVVELRSPEVLTLFLETWLKDPGNPWTIIRLGENAMGTWKGRRGRWVGWVAWR